MNVYTAYQYQPPGPQFRCSGAWTQPPAAALAKASQGHLAADSLLHTGPDAQRKRYVGGNGWHLGASQSLELTSAISEEAKLG